MLLSESNSKSEIPYWLGLMMALFLSLLLGGCISNKPSKKEAKQEKQSILNYLHKKYPEDSFRIQRHYVSVPTFPQNTKFFLKRDDYKYAKYYVLSQKYNQSFGVDFEWDDKWSQVSIKEDDYPTVLVAQAQQQRIANLALPYIKSIVGVDLGNRPEASDITNVKEAHAFLDKRPDIDMSYFILVTVPNATNEATLQETAQKIHSHIAHISHKGDKKHKSTEIYFYSDDQMDVSEITLELSKYQPIRNTIRDIERHYRIDAPYYQMFSHGRTLKGKRFGM